LIVPSDVLLSNTQYKQFQKRVAWPGWFGKDIFGLARQFQNSRIPNSIKTQKTLELLESMEDKEISVEKVKGPDEQGLLRD
jgi:hypothetical protein